MARRLAADGIDVTGVAWRAGLDPRALLAIHAALRPGPSGSPTVLHAHDPHALVLSAAALGAFALRERLTRPFAPRTPSPRRLAVPLVATRRVTFPVRRPSAWFRADAVIAVSAAVANVLIRSGIDRARISVVHSGLEPDDGRRGEGRQLRAALRLADGTPLAMSLAALTPEKDHTTLLAAAARLRDTELHWVIVGDGPLRAQLEDLRGRLDLTDRVHFVGNYTDADLLLDAAAVLVVSSRAEGFGTAALAALGRGVPVVATRVGGLPELLADDAGVLVAPGDDAALAAEVRRLITDAAHRSAMAERGRARAAIFSAARMATRTLAVYRLLAQPH